MVIVSRAHLAQAVFDEEDLTRRAARVLVGSLFEEMAPRLVAGERVRVYGLVQFPIRESRGIIRELQDLPFTLREMHRSAVGQAVGLVCPVLLFAFIGPFHSGGRDVPASRTHMATARAAGPV